MKPKRPTPTTVELDQDAIRRLEMAIKPPLRNVFAPGIAGAMLGLFGAGVLGIPLAAGAIGSYAFWEKALRDKARATVAYFDEGDFDRAIHSGLQLHDFIMEKTPHTAYASSALWALSRTWKMAISSQRPELVADVRRAFHIHYFPPCEPKPSTKKVFQTLDGLIQAFASKQPMEAAEVAKEASAYAHAWASRAETKTGYERLTLAAKGLTIWSENLETYARQIAQQLSRPHVDDEFSFYLQEHGITPSALPYLGNSKELAEILSNADPAERDHLLSQLPDLATDLAGSDRIDLQMFALKIRQTLFQVANPQNPFEILPAADNLLASYMQLEMVPQIMKLRTKMGELAGPFLTLTVHEPGMGVERSIRPPNG